MSSFAKYPSLQDKRILISGGAGGIGASFVEHFCEQGAKVAFLDVDANTAQQTAAKIHARTGNLPSYKVCDLKDIEQSLECVRGLEDALGPFQVLINNAGHDGAHAFDEVTPEYWDDRVAVNLRHQFFLAQHVARIMKQAGSGAIINMGSISWMLGLANVTAYTTMKSAVNGMTKSMARELGSFGIRVNSIAPGWVLTERQLEKARQFPEKLDQYLEKQSIKKSLEPADISRLALWLCADDSQHVSGQTFIVDGGIV